MQSSNSFIDILFITIKGRTCRPSIVNEFSPRKRSHPKYLFPLKHEATLISVKNIINSLTCVICCAAQSPQEPVFTPMITAMNNTDKSNETRWKRTSFSFSTHGFPRLYKEQNYAEFYCRTHGANQPEQAPLQACVRAGWDNPLPAVPHSPE